MIESCELISKRAESVFFVQRRPEIVQILQKAGGNTLQQRRPDVVGLHTIVLYFRRVGDVQVRRQARRAVVELGKEEK